MGKDKSKSIYGKGAATWRESRKNGYGFWEPIQVTHRDCLFEYNMQMVTIYYINDCGNLKRLNKRNSDSKSINFEILKSKQITHEIFDDLYSKMNKKAQLSFYQQKVSKAIDVFEEIEKEAIEFNQIKIYRPIDRQSKFIPVKVFQKYIRKLRKGEMTIVNVK